MISLQQHQQQHQQQKHQQQKHQQQVIKRKKRTSSWKLCSNTASNRQSLKFESKYLFSLVNMGDYGKPGTLPSAPLFEAPPPYSPPGQHMNPLYPLQPQAAFPNQPILPMGYVPPRVYPTGPPAYYSPAQDVYPPPYMHPVQAQVRRPQGHYVVSAEFDPAARFNQHSLPRIPPPPPGCPPNAAQLAMMSGQPTTTFVAKQQHGNFFTGSGSGGFKFF